MAELASPRPQSVPAAQRAYRAGRLALAGAAVALSRRLVLSLLHATRHGTLELHETHNGSERIWRFGRASRTGRTCAS